MKKAVLIVEDDDGILSSLSEFVESEGYQPQTAMNGRKALDFLSSAEVLPSAIILDLMMPVMDGLQFREAQVKDPRIAGIPVILVSADHQLQIKMQKMGVVDYLRKPIDIDVLSEKLKKLV